MKLKSIVAGIALLSSGTAFAGATGNVGAFSEYMFRGVEQSNGAAVQGGLDWTHDSGFYLGTWVSNTSYAGYSAHVSYETDLYGGWTRKFNDVFSIDVGAVYYYYRDDTRLNTVEGYVGVLLGAGGVKLYYTPHYFGTIDADGSDESAFYVTGNYPVPLNKDASLTLTPQLGFSSGDGVRDFVVAAFEPGTTDDNYIDYSVTLAKALESGFTFSLGLIGTNLEKDDEKLVIGLKKSFAL